MASISSVFSCFFCKHEKPAARGRTRGSRNKKPGAACRPGSGVVSGVVSVNIFFWKILVTRVKRKIEPPSKSFTRHRKSAHAAMAHPVSCSPSRPACDRLRARRTPMKSVVVVGLLSALMIGRANAQVYYTYSEWERLSDQARTMYIAGAYDSLISIVSPDTASTARHYSKCVSGRVPIEQLAKNV